MVKNEFDKGAMIMGVIICILFGYSHFIIRRFFPDGDKYILLFSNALAVIGMGILYRLDSPAALEATDMVYRRHCHIHFSGGTFSKPH